MSLIPVFYQPHQVVAFTTKKFGDVVLKGYIDRVVITVTRMSTTYDYYIYVAAPPKGLRAARGLHITSDVLGTDLSACTTSVAPLGRLRFRDLFKRF